MKLEIIEWPHPGQYIVKIGSIEVGRAFYETRLDQHVFVPTDKIVMSQDNLEFLSLKLNELDWERKVKFGSA